MIFNGPTAIDDPNSVCQISMNGRKGITGRPVKSDPAG